MIVHNKTIAQEREDVWIFYNGALRGRRIVMHCDQLDCVNPRHMSLGPAAAPAPLCLLGPLDLEDP